MKPIDLTMTAARRPDLLYTTLSSFSTNLFSRLPVRTFFINIDPIWGSMEQAAETERIARSFFGSVLVRTPETPSYAGAVKWLWSQPETDWFLHLEDDWILSHKISLRMLQRQMQNSSTGEIKIANWTRLRRRRKTIDLGVFPVFVRTSFARAASAHMNADLDPDKQFRNGTNPNLESAVSKWRAVHFGNLFTKETAIDIGRTWRDKRGIEKRIVDGISVWTEGNS